MSEDKPTISAAEVELLRQRFESLFGKGRYKEGLAFLAERIEDAHRVAPGEWTVRFDGKQVGLQVYDRPLLVLRPQQGHYLALAPDSIPNAFVDQLLRVPKGEFRRKGGELEACWYEFSTDELLELDARLLDSHREVLEATPRIRVDGRRASPEIIDLLQHELHPRALPEITGFAAAPVTARAPEVTEVVASAALEPSAPQGPFDEHLGQLTVWYEREVRPFLRRFAPDRVEQLEGDFLRARKLLNNSRAEWHVCFIGNSGVGKSTLLNVLVDPLVQLLPQGGIGPLTAQATRVRYSEVPYFRARYLSATRLARVAFALAKGYEAQLKREGKADAGLATGLPQPDDDAALLEQSVAETDGGRPTGEAQGVFESYRRQAQLLIRGDQFKDTDVPYLVKALKVAMSRERAVDEALDPDDLQRVITIQRALEVGRKGQQEVHRRLEQPADRADFMQDLRAHAAGHLAPLIQSLEVGWNAAPLDDGLVLVDLPGVGVANDEYRAVTAHEVRQARAIVLVVDRSGVTEASAELLHTTGFLTSLLHDGGDPDLELPRLMVAVVKLDLTADDSRSLEGQSGTKRPWIEHFKEACDKARHLVAAQIRVELSKLVDAGGESTLHERREMVDRVLESVEVFPLSPLEYRKFHADDEDERARVKTAEDSLVPAMIQVLEQRAASTLSENEGRFRDHILAVGNRLDQILDRIEERWRDIGLQTEETRQLRRDLEVRLRPLEQALANRRGAFRSFLRDTVPTKIEAAVQRASDDARRSIVRLIGKYEDYHWATLRATVRRDGRFQGSRTVDLPSELGQRFEEPVAVIWSKEILTDLRRKTRELGEDYVALQAELIEWARSQGTRVRLKTVEGLHEELREDVKQLAQVGKEAIDELREEVKDKLGQQLPSVIGRCCRRFVEQHHDVGRGVRLRILDMLRNELTDAVVEAARRKATEILTRSYDEVCTQIQDVLKKLPDPLASASDAIAVAHERATEKEHEKQLAEVTEGLAGLRSSRPAAPERNVA